MQDQVLNFKKTVLILDCTARPRLALAEGAEGTKAICSGLNDIRWFSEYIFPSAPGCTDPVHMEVTSVDAGKITESDNCRFTVEISYDASYTSDEILATIKRKTFCTFSFREELQEIPDTDQDWFQTAKP